MATLEELTERVRAGVGADSGLGKSFKLDLKGEGFIHIDGAEVSNDDKPADLTVKVSRNDLEALGKGKLNPMTAAITGPAQGVQIRPTEKPTSTPLQKPSARCHGALQRLPKLERPWAQAPNRSPKIGKIIVTPNTNNSK